MNWLFIIARSGGLPPAVASMILVCGSVTLRERTKILSCVAL